MNFRQYSDLDLEQQIIFTLLKPFSINIYLKVKEEYMLVL